MCYRQMVKIERKAPLTIYIFFIVATRVISKNYRSCCTPRSRKSSRRGGITFQKELIGHR